MSVRIIRDEEVHRLLPMAECIEVMADCLCALARDDAVQPLRMAMWKPDRSGLLGVMPGWLGEPATLGLKVITVTPGNNDTELDAHQGALLLFDTERGQLLAMIDATAITAVRTAAVSAVATRALARADASTLAILGSGTQAWTHLEAIRAVRPIERVRVWSRREARAQRFAERAADRWGVPVSATPSAAEAVEEADIICTVTGASEPVLRGAWVAPGAHVNAVGACVPVARELDTEAVLRAKLFVDRRESALSEAGDVLIPMAEGRLNEDHILGEIGELLLDPALMQGASGDITLFKSLGLAIEDLAAGHHVLTKATEQGVGVEVELGGLRHEAR